jgi:asparagine synthase (glutamine-hydrolysing)
MCGICGTVSRSGFADPEAARAQVEAMLQSLSHRGPDDVSQVATETAVLGVTRLAIRGLQDANQPMVDAETGVIAVCNGEIDNHRDLRRWLMERGRPVHRATDVGVIPGLFLELDEDFASRMVGNFAVAVWDPRTRRLILARDRAGERPLFYASRGCETVFATEIAALASHNRLPTHLDQGALRKYLQLGIFPSPDTPFSEIRKVAPGETIRVDAGGVRRKRYWRWQITETAKEPPSVEGFDQTFRAAVKRQSDVEVDFGVFLSGGIDSSLVSAVVRSLYPTRPLKAYTLRFKEESFDEGSFAEVVAKRLEMELVTVWVEPEELREGMKSLIRLVGEPLADPAWIPTALLARRAAQDIKVALVGEGADELFGGYPTYIGAGLAERFARLPGWIRRLVARAVSAVPPSEKKVTVSFLLKRFVQGTELEGMARHRLWASNIAPPLLARLGVKPVGPEEGEVGAGDLLDRVQQWDLETPLAEGLLTKADRASMSSALELRAPFLDQAVMEFARSLPIGERVRGLTTKVFLKRYALRYLPEAIVNRRKRGLSVPIGRWLRGPLHEWAQAALGCGRLEQVGIKASAALELLSEHCQRKADHARALWTLLVLGEWLEWVADEIDSCSGETLRPAETAQAH